MKAISRFSLRIELMTGILIVAVIPLVVVMSIAVWRAGSAVENAVFEKFMAVEEIKKQQLNKIISDFKTELEGLSHSNQVTGMVYWFDEYAANEKFQDTDPFPVESDRYHYIHGQASEFPEHFIKTYGYEDYILINRKGHVVYTAKKGKDLGANLKYGKMQNSALASIWNKIMSSKKMYLQDFAFYEPSGKHVCFIGTPVSEKAEPENILGAVVLRVPAEAFSGIIHERIGMGESGRFYLITRTPDNKLEFRNNSDSGMKTSFAVGDRVTEKHLVKAFGNGTHQMKYTGTDHTSYLVTSVPFEFGSATWNLIGTIRYAEAITPILSMKNWLYIVVIGGILTILFVVYLFTYYIAGNLNSFVSGLQTITEEVDHAANHLASSSQSLASGASHQASSIEETNAQLKELENISKNNADESGSAKQTVIKASEVAKSGSRAVGELVQSMHKIVENGNEIGKVAMAIEDIAFQTNLLALNAAVEAARAGEQGRGFAVVADEVGNLAKRVSENAKMTSTLIETSGKLADEGIEKTGNARSSLDAILSSVDKVAIQVDNIARSSNEQALNTKQIDSAVSSMNEIVQSNSASAQENSSASQQLSSHAATMKKSVQDLLIFINGEKAVRPSKEDHTVQDINMLEADFSSF